MKITLKAFATVKDIFGYEEKELIVTDEITVGKIITDLSVSHPELKKIADTLLYAVNENYCTADTKLNDGDIMAIFPPVSGG